MLMVALSILMSGVIILAVSVPLMRRRVPMNRLWGVRIPASFRSDEDWYDINAYAGRLLVLGSIPIIAAGMVGVFLPERMLVPYAWSAVAITLLSVGLPCVWLLIWVQRRHRSRSTS